MGPRATLEDSGRRGMRCPRCGQPAVHAAGPPLPATVNCAACGQRLDVLTAVTVVSDDVRHIGGCCAGTTRHDLRWCGADGSQGRTRFEHWVQDHVLFRPGDRATVVFASGDLGRRKGCPMPLSAENHTLGTTWALPGARPVEPLR